MEVLIMLILLFALLSVLVARGLKRLHASAGEIIVGIVYIISIALFGLGLIVHSNPYYRAIDPIDMTCYSPFSDRHAMTLIFYFIIFNASLLLVWIKNNVLPPLMLTLSLVFIAIGIILNIVILIQVSAHNTESLQYASNSAEEQILFFFAPFFSIVIGFSLIYDVKTQKINETFERTYSNKYLNILNTFLATRSRNPVWIAILLFPVFFLVTLLLILFGQDTNSIVKLFTDTTTWKLSQQMHPPILDHTGHYLCTVAALGDPKIVKPLRIGQRNGKQIIVNRQLLIANAFEEMVQDFSPKLHRIIRQNYDKYGYNISTKINTPHSSNITYMIMKPLEWLFLICLYLFCNNPEQKINSQYTK